MLLHMWSMYGLPRIHECPASLWVHVSMTIGGFSGHYPGADLQSTHCVAITLLHGFPFDPKTSSTEGSCLALRQGQLEGVGVLHDHGVNLSPTGGGHREQTWRSLSPQWTGWRHRCYGISEDRSAGLRMYLHKEEASCMVPLYISVPVFLHPSLLLQ